MRPLVTLLLTGLVSMASPPIVFGSGSAPVAAPKSNNFRQSSAAHSSHATRTLVTEPSQSGLAEEPYNRGKALFSGQYRLGNPKLSAANIAEKKLRLVSLRSALPRAERGKINAEELARRLTNREMNSLEYYLGMRFGKFVTKTPSWARTEPPPRVASSN